MLVDAPTHPYSPRGGSVPHLCFSQRFFFSPGSGHSLSIMDNKATYEFHGIGERDSCIKIIVTQCAAAGQQPSVLEVGQ